MTGYSMVKNDQKINQLRHCQQTILNTTINNNDTLNVVMMHSNPLNYVTRDKLGLPFKEIMLLYPNVILLIVELVYGLYVRKVLMNIKKMQKLMPIMILTLILMQFMKNNLNYKM